MSKRIVKLCLLVLACAGIAPYLSPSAGAEPAAAFDRDIAPLIARRCAECHNSTDKKGGLDLTRKEAALKGGDGGVAIVVGKPEDSSVWQRVETDEMPPKHPLSAEEKKLLRTWITDGARWGVDPIDPFKYSSDRRGGYDWWSFQPLRVASPPESLSARNAVDSFIDAELRRHGLTPSPPADPRVLARRVYFDLLGLPPSPELLEEFVGEASRGEPDAYERLVDRLLARPEFGERWARHWLDVAHFGESDGFEYDRLRPNAWPYRDWVIGAMNRDLPYDEFARLQVAGDLLRPDDPQGAIATGFLVGGAHDALMPAVELMRQIMRQDELEDLVGTFSQTFLGLTVHCGRCHDHKFDPIRQSDYYGIASALGGVKRGERPLPPSSAGVVAEQQVRSLEKELKELEEPARAAILARRRASLRDAGERPQAVPQPIAAWDFTKDLRDQVGASHGNTHGMARRDQTGLMVDGQQAYVAAVPLEKSLTAKTLSAVVKLANLTQRGGGVITVQTLDGQFFDSIVFGEQEPARWMAGSNNFARTQSFQGPEETRAAAEPVHLAWVYESSGVITGYVRGRPYGSPYKTTVQSYEAGKSQVVFGMRHSPPGGNRMLAGTLLRAALYDRALSAEEVGIVAAAAGTLTDYVSDEELAKELGSTGLSQRESLKTRIAALRDTVQRAKSGRVFAITPQAAPVAHVLVRGNPRQPAEAVSASGLTSLAGANPNFGLAPDAPEAQRRTRLVEWLTDPRNPLFSRTIVNRLWHHHYGAGLVATPNDLGFSGGLPSHPELLDWMAGELVRVDFSLKRLHREQVLAAAYRRSSAPRTDALAVDADNRWWWRMNPRRLEAEAVRDAMLAISGQLNREMGGPGYHDFRPFLRGGTQFYEPLDPVGAPFQRRSVYRTWARGGHNRLLDTFDCPDPSTSTPKRSVTTTPLQALALLNNSFVLRMADSLADDVMRASGKSAADSKLEDLVPEMFERAYGRRPQGEEAATSVEFARKHGLPALARVLLNTNAFVYVE
jgi:mono/diheme cytochrome c family protein